MTTTYPHPLDQLATTYRRMATEARYRPAAPSDGCGNIIPSGIPDQLDVHREAAEYATRWREHEGEGVYSIGCPDYLDRPALVLMVEAARMLCGGDTKVARRLLDMAGSELDR